MMARRHPCRDRPEADRPVPHPQEATMSKRARKRRDRKKKAANHGRKPNA
nr:hypothetical protein [Ornithinimicrobium sp. CNJ-824]